MNKSVVRVFLSLQVVLVMISISATTCMADEIIFLNGDRLTGKLVNINKTNVTFNPELMGIITFDISKTESISTDEPVKINFADGTSIITTSIAFAEGEVLITGDKTDGAINIPPDEVFSAGKPGAGRKANWKGSISGGFTKTDNDDDTMTFNSILQLQRRTPKHRLRMRSVLFVEKEKDDDTRKNETTEENFNADTRYDYFFKKKWFWSNGANYKRDIINDLDYRVIVGSSLGYQWLDSATKHLDTIAGFAYTTEHYSEEDNSYLSYLFGVNLDYKLWDKLTATLDANITPKANDPSDYVARGYGGLKLNATEKFFINFSAIFDYNSQVKNADSTDTKFLLGVGWDFL